MSFFQRYRCLDCGKRFKVVVDSVQDATSGPKDSCWYCYSENTQRFIREKNKDGPAYYHWTSK